MPTNDETHQWEVKRQLDRPHANELLPEWQSPGAPIPTVPLIELAGVNYFAGDSLLLDNVDWRLYTGQHTAILGINGSGKTTLLRCATGYVRPNRGGVVKWLGKEQIDLRALRRGIGWVASTLVAKVPHRERVVDLVVSGRHAQWGLRQPIRRFATPNERARAEWLLEQAECLPLRQRRFAELSQGEQQRVLLARGLMAYPLLLVLDEPCVGLDPGGRERFLAHLERTLAAENPPTLVLVTHHVEVIIPAIIHVATMRDGQLNHAGSPRETLTPKLLGNLFGAFPHRIDEHQGRFWPIW